MTASRLNHDQHVTAVISQQVKAGCEQHYEAWMKGISAAARQFSGHLGVSILRPQPGVLPNYVIVLQFDTCDHLQAWLQSDIRQGWIEQVQPLIHEPGSMQILTGLEAWFQLPSQPAAIAPKRYKQAVLVWLGVMLVAVFVSPWVRTVLTPLPIFIELPISVAITVVLLSYLIMPRLTHWFRGWLFS